MTHAFVNDPRGSDECGFCLMPKTHPAHANAPQAVAPPQARPAGRECWVMYDEYGGLIGAISSQPVRPEKWVRMIEAAPIETRPSIVVAVGGKAWRVPSGPVEGAGAPQALDLADVEIMDRMVPPLKYPPWGELGAAWKRLRAILVAGGASGSTPGAGRPMTWTRAKPTKPGIYRMRGPNGVTGEPLNEIVQVAENPRGLMAVCVEDGRDMPVGLMYDHFEWAGPYDLPDPSDEAKAESGEAPAEPAPDQATVNQPSSKKVTVEPTLAGSQSHGQKGVENEP